jgi:hypothetical protein
MHVTCAPESLTVVFTNQTSAAAFLRHVVPGAILVGGAQLGCKNATTGKASIVLAEARSLPTLSGATVRIITKRAQITQVLKNARATMNLQPSEMQAMASCNTGDLITGQCTTDLGASHTFDGWKYDYSGHNFYTKNIGGATAAITCSTCYASFQPSIAVDVHIQNNNLNHLSVTTSGHASLKIIITASIEKSFSDSGELQLTEIDLPSVTFFIGAFPVNLDFKIPISLGYEYSANAKATITTGVSVDDTLTGGLVWDGTWHETHSNNFKASVMAPTLSVDGSASLKVYVSPKIEVTFEAVCTIGIAVEPYALFQGNGHIGSTAANINGAVYAGFDVKIDGGLGLVLDGHQIGPQQHFGPQTIIDEKQSVWAQGHDF